MLMVDNNDDVGIAEHGAPETLDFWEVCQCLSVEEMCPWLDEGEAADVEALVEDVHRLRRQCNELIELVPATKDKVTTETKSAVLALEERIAKLVRYNIYFTR